MYKRSATRGAGLEQAKRQCFDREIQAMLPWLPPWETYPEGVRHQRSRRIGRN